MPHQHLPLEKPQAVVDHVRPRAMAFLVVFRAVMVNQMVTTPHHVLRALDEMVSG